MTTATDPKYPTTKSGAARFLSRSRKRLYETHLRGKDIVRDYHDHKAQQFLESMSDLLIAETMIDSWVADLGSNGCQVVV